MKRFSCETIGKALHWRAEMDTNPYLNPKALEFVDSISEIRDGDSPAARFARQYDLLAEEVSVFLNYIVALAYWEWSAKKSAGTPYIYEGEFNAAFRTLANTGLVDRAFEEALGPELGFPASESLVALAIKLLNDRLTNST